MTDNARVYGKALIYGFASIYGDANIFNKAQVFGDTRISGYTDICHHGLISNNNDYLYFKGLGSYNRDTTFFKCNDGEIYVSCGCFKGTLTEFENQVKKTHGDNKYAKEYLECIKIVKIHFEI